MKTKTSRVTGAPVKAPTGITGFDAITGGGLPRARTTLLVGGPGSGKTVFALQFLVHGARQLRQSGIFVAFEEQSKHIVANADGFGWKLTTLRRNKITFMDAQPKPDLVQSGDFDLSGMLAALGAQITQTGATRMRIVNLNAPCAESASLPRHLSRTSGAIRASAKQLLFRESPRQPAICAPRSPPSAAGDTGSHNVGVSRCH